MQTRREVITQAATIAGINVAAPILGAAAPYVRLPGEQGTMADELDRFRAEVDHITEVFELRPATDTLTAITATWANLDSCHVPRAELAELKAQTAVLAGHNTIALHDPANGRRWFNLAHTYARLAGKPELISLAHAREAHARLYWGDRKKDTLVEVHLSRRYALTREQQGMAYMVYARTVASMGHRKHAVAAVERAVERADDAGQRSPRPDGWITSQAHMMAARALAGFAESLPAVEAHTREALAALPQGAVSFRVQARLNLGESRAAAREYDGAEEVMVEVLNSLAGDQMLPIHVNRIHEIVAQADNRNVPMRRVKERLAALR